MYRNYIKTTIRNLIKNKSSTLINLLGLSIGIACSLFAFIWISDEISTDRFHENSSKLYRILSKTHMQGEVSASMSLPYPMEATIENDFPEIERAVSLIANQEILFQYENNLLKKTGIYASDDFFELFTFPLILGEPAQVLSDPSFGVISESMARVLFGVDWRVREDILGQIITYNHDNYFLLTGVFRDVPDQSTLQFDWLLPVVVYVQNHKSYDNWSDWRFQQYALVAEGTRITALNDNLAPVLTLHDKYLQNNPEKIVNVFLLPFKDLYLYGKFENGEVVGGRIEYIRLSAIIAFLILVLGCINFINMSTASSSQRAREIGVRKAIGATRPLIIGQFLGESLILVFLSALLALLMVYVLLPNFNLMTGKELYLPWSYISFWITLLATVGLTTLLAGLYPAFILSSFNAITVFRNRITGGFKGKKLRKGLVLFQFTLSLMMCIAALTIYWQIQYIQTKPLGMDREHIFMFQVGDIKNNPEVIRDQLMQQIGISNVSFVNQDPISIQLSSTPKWDGAELENRTRFLTIFTDDHFLPTMNIPLVSGRNFDLNLTTDKNKFVVNETAARVLGFNDPVGKTIEFWGIKGEIIGVTKDFHIQSFHHAMMPLIIGYNPQFAKNILIKPEAGKRKEAIEGAKSLYKANYPNDVFEYSFLDDNYRKLYGSEETTGQLAVILAIISFVIACLGLVSLTSHAITLRKKEIGIRKVHGGSVNSIMWLFCRDFIILKLIGFAIIVPIAYFLLSNWLDNYAYRINLSWWLFAGPGVLLLIIVLLAVSSQSLRTIRVNPITLLRYK